MVWRWRGRIRRTGVLTLATGLEEFSSSGSQVYSNFSVHTMLLVTSATCPSGALEVVPNYFRSLVVRTAGGFPRCTVGG